MAYVLVYFLISYFPSLVCPHPPLFCILFSAAYMWLRHELGLLSRGGGDESNLVRPQTSGLPRGKCVLHPGYGCDLADHPFVPQGLQWRAELRFSADGRVAVRSWSVSLTLANDRLKCIREWNFVCPVRLAVFLCILPFSACPSPARARIKYIYIYVDTHALITKSTSVQL